MAVIHISEEARDYLRVIAMEEGVTMKDMVEWWIESYIDDMSSDLGVAVEPNVPPRQDWSEARRERHADVMRMVALRKKLQMSSNTATTGGQP